MKIASQGPPRTWAARLKKVLGALLATPKLKPRAWQTVLPALLKIYTAKPETPHQMRLMR